MVSDPRPGATAGDHMEIEVGADRDGQRLDVILSQEGNMSRRAARRLIEGGSVFVDAKRTRVQSSLV